MSEPDDNTMTAEAGNAPWHGSCPDCPLDGWHGSSEEAVRDIMEAHRHREHPVHVWRNPQEVVS